MTISGASARNYEKTGRCGVAPQKVVSSGLVFLALLAASGCTMSGNEQKNKKPVPTPEKTERVLQKIFNPAMARAGQKAVNFARKHKDSAMWYELTPGQKELSISSSDNNHKLNITMKKDSDTKDLASGDVTAVEVDNVYTTADLVTKKDTFESSVAVEAWGEGDSSCSIGPQARSRYSHDSSEDRFDFMSFTTANRCGGSFVGLKADDTMLPQDAAHDIVHDMNENLRYVLSEASKDK